MAIFASASILADKFLEIPTIPSISFDVQSVRKALNVDPRLFEKPDDMYLSFEEICSKAGFKFEQHTTVTDSGYILNLFRIPGMIREPTTHSGNQIKSPLFFQHGFADSADAFVMNTNEKSSAFMAARAGYDVWLGNIRGNKYSRAHETLDPDADSRLFFDFSVFDAA